MVSNISWLTLGVVGGFILGVWIICREKPPVFQTFANNSPEDEEEEFAARWFRLEAQTGFSFAPKVAHHLLYLEEKYGSLLFTVPVEETGVPLVEDYSVYTPFWERLRDRIETGKMTEFPDDGRA